MTLPELQRSFINRYQGGFPVVERPYQAVAARLGCGEITLLETIRRALDSGVLSRFGPLYNAVQLGGDLTLAAMTVPEEHYDHIAALVNDFAEVAHNYRREHKLNMWFVLATESPQGIGAMLKRIEQATGLEVYNFPKLHEFYVGLWLNVKADGSTATVPLPDALEPSTEPALSSALPFDGIDRKIIRATQTGLPLVTTPYRTIAEQCGTIEEAIEQRLQYMIDCGVIRRIGAVPNHYRLGLRANGMTVWNIDDERVMEMGRQIAALDFVSHCYLRPRHPSVWPYNLFAMVHGRTRGEVALKVAQMADMLGHSCRAHDTLFSTAILKKTGMRLAA